MALALGFAILAIKLWRADFSVPLRPGSDATEALVVIKAMVQHGWDLNVPELGAPFGLSLSDFPATAGDTGSLVLLKLFSLFTSNPAVILNLYFLAGFPLVALSAFLVMRRLGISRLASVVAATLYALLPPHFLRGEAHVFLGAYISAPVGCYLILRVLGDEPIFVPSAGARGWSAWLTWRNLRPVALCVLIGAFGTDYAAFTIVLILVCAVARAVATKSRRSLIPPLVLIVAIAGTLAVQYLPTAIYHASHGPNPAADQRYPYESELYGLRIPDLVFPSPQDRIPPLAQLGKNYLTGETTLGTVNEATSDDTLGLIGAFSFVGLIGLSLVAAVRRRPSGAMPVADRAAFATLVAVLAGVSGAFPMLFATFVSADVRAWNRIVVFIGFFAMLAVALVLDRIRSRLHHSGRRVTAAAILAVVLLFGAFEQTNNGPAFVAPYAQYAAADRNVGVLMAAIEHKLPSGASIWQLPYTAFPETPPQASELPYDQLVPYLHSHGLRFSGGALKGRPTDWQARLVGVPLTTQLRGVTAAGFAGVLVDRLAYADHGTAVIEQLTAVVGPPSVTSGDGRYVFFDLRPYARSLRARIPAARLVALARSTVTASP